MEGGKSRIVDNPPPNKVVGGLMKGEHERLIGSKNRWVWVRLEGHYRGRSLR